MPIMTKYEDLIKLTPRELAEKLYSIIQEEKKKGLSYFHASYMDDAYFGKEKITEEVVKRRLIGSIQMLEASINGEFEDVTDKVL